MIDAYYADPHMGHRQIIGYCDRPFDSVDHQTEELIRRYNVTVGPNDFVLWVGDCFLSMREVEAWAITERMNGRKGLVIGNHDRSKAWMCRVGFDFVVDSLQTHIAGRRVQVCHYPYPNTARRGGYIDTRYLDRRPKRQKGEVLIHGHTHSSKRRDGNQIHVGVDAWAYAPVTHKEVAALVAEV